MRENLQVLQVSLHSSLIVAGLTALLLLQFGCGGPASGSKNSPAETYQRSEGFSSDASKLPSAIAPDWNSVYMVLIDRPLNYEMVLRMNEVSDLALIAVKVPSDESTPPALKFAKSCKIERGSSLYTVGFPYTAMRTDANARPIENKNAVTKRWSQGVAVSPVDDNLVSMASAAAWFGTTVDIVHGNSGGPLLNAEGHVVGVMKGRRTADEKGYAYTGRDTGDLYPASFAVPCASLKAFLGL